MNLDNPEIKAAYLQGMKDVYEILNTCEVHEEPKASWLKNQCMVEKENIKDLNEAYDCQTMCDSVALEFMIVILRRIKEIERG